MRSTVRRVNALQRKEVSIVKQLMLVAFNCLLEALLIDRLVIPLGRSTLRIQIYWKFRLD